MTLVPLPIEIKGVEQILQIENDPPWGSIQRLLKTANVTDENGKTKIDMMSFLDQLLEIVIVSSSGDFNAKNRTMMQTLPTSVMTKLIGGVTKILPLQEYLDNMGELQTMTNPL